MIRHLMIGFIAAVPQSLLMLAVLPPLELWRFMLVLAGVSAIAMIETTYWE